MGFTGRRQSRPEPSWGTQWLRSFANIIPQAAGTAAGSAIKGAIGDYFRRKEEGRAQDTWTAQQSQLEEQKKEREQREQQAATQKGLTESLFWNQPEQARARGEGPAYLNPKARAALGAEPHEGMGPSMPRGELGISEPSLPEMGRQVAETQKGAPEWAVHGRRGTPVSTPWERARAQNWVKQQDYIRRVKTIGLNAKTRAEVNRLLAQRRAMLDPMVFSGAVQTPYSEPVDTSEIDAQIEALLPGGGGAQPAAKRGISRAEYDATIRDLTAGGMDRKRAEALTGERFFVR